MFDNLVIASESSVTVALEKDYVDSLGLNTTLADSLKTLAGAKKSCTVTDGTNFSSQDVTDAKATLSAVPDGDATADATNALVLDFSSYSLFVKYVNAVKENAGTTNSHGTVTIHLSAKTGDNSWTIGDINGSIRESLVDAAEADANTKAGHKAIRDRIGTKFTLVFNTSPTTSAIEIADVLDGEATAQQVGAAKYSVVIDLTKAGDTNLAALITAAAGKGDIKGASITFSSTPSVVNGTAT